MIFCNLYFSKGLLLQDKIIKYFLIIENISLIKIQQLAIIWTHTLSTILYGVVKGHNV